MARSLLCIPWSIVLNRKGISRMTKMPLFFFLVIGLIAGPAFSAGIPDAIFTEVPCTAEFLRAAAPEPDHAAQIIRTRYVEIHEDWLEVLEAPAGRARLNGAGGFDLNLFEDTRFWAVLDTAHLNRSGSVSWVGHLEDVKNGSVVLVVKNGSVVGNVRTPYALYEIRDAGSGVTAVHEVDSSAYPPEADPIPAGIDAAGEEIARDPPVEWDSGAVIDVMVVYTQAAGYSGIESLIDLAVTETNQSYENSGIDQRLNLVHTAQVVYDESDFDWEDTLYRLQWTSDGYMDDVHDWRDAWGADEVVLIVSGDGIYCGIAFLMTNVSTGFAGSAFAVVSRSCATGYFSFAHELGHNMGARHDWYVDAAVNSPYSHNKGYVNQDDRWRTIMAYNSECSASGFYCTRLPYWSNPDVDYGGGVPMGVPEGTSTSCITGVPEPNCDADNRKTLNKTANTVANFRQSITPAYTLSIIKDGTGSGTVANVLGGIHCGSDCEEDFFENEVVTLTATEDAGSFFQGWGGGECSGTGDCVVTMDDHKNVTATFDLISGDDAYVPCGVYTPCYDTVNEGIAGTGNGAHIRIADNGGPYDEDMILDASKTITLHALDAAFANPASVSIDGMLDLSLGTLILLEGALVIR